MTNHVNEINVLKKKRPVQDRTGPTVEPIRIDLDCGQNPDRLRLRIKRVLV